MTPSIAALIEKIQALEGELDAELAKRRAELRVGLEHGRIAFEEELLRRHRALRQKLLPYLFGASPLVVLTAPVIYAGIVPFVLLDIFVSIFQAVCFPIYGIAKIKRGDYLVFDRHHLAYLNALEKLNCAYCSYANGIIAFTREIAARTEQYWCPDQACAPRHRHPCALSVVRRLRRRRGLSGAARRVAQRSGQGRAGSDKIDFTVIPGVAPRNDEVGRRPWPSRSTTRRNRPAASVFALCSTEKRFRSTK
jgi:hypothetical protein